MYLWFIALALIFIQPQPAWAGLNIRVGLVWQLAGETFLGFETVQGAYTLTIDDTVIIRNISAGASYRALSSPWGLLVFRDGQVIGTGGRLKFEPAYGKLPVLKLLSAKGVRDYRGGLEISQRGDASLSVVNTLGEQEYLYGVVPVEMSNSWAAQGAEALKAQAVAARTYLYSHYDRKQAKGYNISDSPNIDQAYAGYGVEGAASKAVDATQAEVLVDKNSLKPINPSYHSHSGGHTENSENVWSAADKHLRGKQDPYSLGQGALADNWAFTASAAAVGNHLGIGPVKEIRTKTYPSGRVKTVEFEDISGKKVIKSGRQFVTLFYPKGRGITRKDFLGTMFRVIKVKQGEGSAFVPEPLAVLLRESLTGPRYEFVDTSVTPPNKLPNPYAVFVFSGKGWGHGVGMAQWGAYGMAKQGYSYRQILEYYYTSVSVRKVGAGE